MQDGRLARGTCACSRVNRVPEHISACSDPVGSLLGKTRWEHSSLVNVHVHARVRYSPARRMQFVQAALDLLHDPLVAVLASVTYPS